MARIACLVGFAIVALLCGRAGACGATTHDVICHRAVNNFRHWTNDTYAPKYDALLDSELGRRSWQAGAPGASGRARRPACLRVAVCTWPVHIADWSRVIRVLARLCGC